MDHIRHWRGIFYTTEGPNIRSISSNRSTARRMLQNTFRQLLLIANSLLRVRSITVYNNLSSQIRIKSTKLRHSVFGYPFSYSEGLTINHL